MTSRLSNVWPRLVIFEGIMGSGKSTATLNIAERLNIAGVAAVGITEGVNPHPIRFDWDEPWNEMPPQQLANSGVAKWQSFIETALTSDRISIVDGQLFHGGLTSLFLLEAEFEMMAAYCREIVTAAALLRPLLIYFRQMDVDKAIHLVCAERGAQWINYQLNWKLSSPYAQGRNLAGVEGLIAVYRAYRALTDRLFDDLEIAKISIENSGREWASYDATIDQALTSTPQPEGL